MDIDKLIPFRLFVAFGLGFRPLMDIDKLIQPQNNKNNNSGFRPLMDIDKLIHYMAKKCKKLLLEIKTVMRL
ncbi:MAG: hypothetical protein RSC60_06345, partial [Christensenellaceae bacterium]